MAEYPGRSRISSNPDWAHHPHLHKQTKLVNVFFMSFVVVVSSIEGVFRGRRVGGGGQRVGFACRE